VTLMGDSSADWDPFEIGRSVSRSYLFTYENIAAYADMAGDPNPLHHDTAFAAGSRFGGVIASAAHSRSEKLNGIVVELIGETRDRETGQVYLMAKGRMLLIGEAVISAAAQRPLETRST